MSNVNNLTKSDLIQKLQNIKDILDKHNIVGAIGCTKHLEKMRKGEIENIVDEVEFEVRM